MHYIHEAGSSGQLVQVRQARAMALNETTDAKALMEANGGVYDIEQDPLWNGEGRSSAPRAFDRKEMAFYQCDHLGTPQELTDHEGSVAWSAQYKAWGEAREAISEAGRRAGFRNSIRFQGKYFDEETGLHYNRYRYYEPQSGSFVSNDPIKLAEFVDALYARVQDFIAAGKNLKIPDSVSSDLNLAIDELVKAKSR